MGDVEGSEVANTESILGAKFIYIISNMITIIMIIVTTIMTTIMVAIVVAIATISTETGLIMIMLRYDCLRGMSGYCFCDLYGWR